MALPLIPLALGAGVVALLVLSRKPAQPSGKAPPVPPVPSPAAPGAEPGRAPPPPPSSLPIPPGSISLPYRSPFEGTVTRPGYLRGQDLTKPLCPAGMKWIAAGSPEDARIPPAANEPWVYAIVQPPVRYDETTGQPYLPPRVPVKGRCVPEGA